MLLESTHKAQNINQNNNKYICINCGTRVKELYKQYSSNVLKLTVCEKCECEADKYIEFDLVLVIIDLVSFQKESYRHIIYNTEFKGLMKLAVLILAMETYAHWSLTLTPTEEITDEAAHFRFYLMLAEVMTKYACFSISTLLLTYFLTNLYKRKQISPVILLKTITLSSFGVFLLLPSLIWDKGVHEFHFTFVLFYTTLSQLFAYEAICNFSKLWSIVVILISTLCKFYSDALYENVEPKILDYFHFIYGKFI